MLMVGRQMMTRMRVRAWPTAATDAPATLRLYQGVIYSDRD